MELIGCVTSVDPNHRVHPNSLIKGTQYGSTRQDEQISQNRHLYESRNISKVYDHVVLTTTTTTTSTETSRIHTIERVPPYNDIITTITTTVAGLTPISDIENTTELNRYRLENMDQPGSETPSSDDLGIDWAEERGKTFVVPKARMIHDGDCASNLDGVSVGREDLEQLMEVVIERFEKKQTMIKHELRGEFEQKRADDRDEYRHTMTVLKHELSNLTKVSDEYEQLKDVQRSLRSQLQVQNESMASINQENVRLKQGMTQTEVLAMENQKLRRENDKLKKGYTRMESEVKKLETNISDKDIEMSSLKTHIDSQYRRLKSDITKTCVKWDSEHETLYSGMKQQHLMLADISKSVKVITKNTISEQEQDQRVNKANQPRSTQKPKYKPFVTGKVTVSNKEYSTSSKRK